MTRLLPLAGLIMRWTAAAAPRDQGVWVRAMRAEFDAIRDGGQAVGWAGLRAVWPSPLAGGCASRPDM